MGQSTKVNSQHKITTTTLSHRIKTALGKQPADLILKNVNVVDIFCHTVHQCDVAITDGKIVGLGKYDKADKIVDCSGKYAMPSFYDTHVHFESSMVTPDQYLSVAVPKGVTSINADSHEIANVCGLDGIQYMIDCVKDAPIDVHFMLPSCVPATPFEHANAVIDGKQIKQLMSQGKFFGLGEMMDYPGVINSNKDVLTKLCSTDIIDGHAPAIKGNALNAYISGRLRTDHESETPEEALEKISKGMYILLREGSQTKNLVGLLPAVNQWSKRRMAFCTDDRYIEEIMRDGSVQNCVVKAVDNGMDIYDALAIASFNAYECYGIRNKGAIAVNFDADFIITDDIVPRNIISVYKGGQLVAHEGKICFSISKPDDTKVRNTVNIKPVTASDFDLDFVPDKTPVIQVLKDTVVTKKVFCHTNEELNMLAVIERHKASGNIGKCWVKDFNLKGGAIAQTVGHDSHNITVIGDNKEDMALAVNALGKSGGMVLVVNGKVEYIFSLNIAGLMSDKPAQQVVEEHHELDARTKALNINKDVAPYMLMSFLSLIVIPEIKLSDSGLFDVCQFKFIEQPKAN